MIKKKPLVLSKEMIIDAPESRELYNNLQMHKPANLVGVHLRIQESLRDEFKLWCIKNKVSMVQAFEEAIKKHINPESI